MTYCNEFLRKSSRNYSLLFSLVVLWVCGVFIGCCYAVSTVGVSPQLMHILAVRRVSFVGVLISVFLPLLLTILLSHFSLHVFLPALSLVKAFTLSFTICCVFCIFGSSSWLILVLLLFSDSIAVILLFWLWVLTLWRKRITLPVLFAVFAIAGVVCAIDFLVISPFLISLLHF